MAAPFMSAKFKYMRAGKRMSIIEAEMRALKQEMEEWKQDKVGLLHEKETLKAQIKELEKQATVHEAEISALKKEIANLQTLPRLEEGEFQPSMMEELNTIKEQVKVIEEEGKKKATWVEVINKTKEKVEAAEKWIEVARKGKGKEVPPTPTLINLTLEEEQRRRVRALHVRVTGLKDTNNVDKEVASLMSLMGVEKSTHTKAWRVGKKSEGSGESSKDRALILRFSSLDEKKEFLRRRPILKKTGIFLGDDLTLSQLAHMREVMPEIRAAREKGKMAFYREGRVVIVERRST